MQKRNRDIPIRPRGLGALRAQPSLFVQENPRLCRGFRKALAMQKKRNSF
ncbi:hypothetical protein HMPREF0262_00892 [Clostridium sp. ATCC 29733]|nr:hypothetical protein HMPREF0262_00892 [Clostridium sp. ATCC 29733]